MMTTHVFAAGILALVLISGAPVLAQNPGVTAAAADIKPGAVTESNEFASKARIGNLFEVETSALAASRTMSPNVAVFAQMMIEDHSTADAQLEAAVKAQGNVTLPAQVDADKAAALQQLAAASGAQFDRLYIKVQTDAHVEAVGLFSGYAQNGQPGALKDFAATTLPTLTIHYAMAKQLR